MKKIVMTVLLSVFLVAPAMAADSKNSVGVNYGLDLDGVIGVQGELDISSSMPDKAPVSIQVFWKNYSQSYQTGAGTYQYSYNGFGAAAIYDFDSVAGLDKKIKPYAGLGLVALNARLSGPNAQFSRAADSGGLYIVGGVRYALAPQVSADLNYNNFGGLTIGAVLNF